MPTFTASGSSTNPATNSAIGEAMRQAMTDLAGRTSLKPTFGFVFASPKYKLDSAVAAAREIAGGADIIGSTTAGEITERGLTKGGLAVMLVASDGLVFDVASTTGVKASIDAAATALCSGFTGSAANAKTRGYIDSTTITLVDGLSGTGERLVSAIMKKTRGFQQVVGGAAGDDGHFAATNVNAATSRGNHGGTDAAVAMHLFSSSPVGVGVDHGLRPSTPKMVVTRATDNIIYELDGKPAFEVYKVYARTRNVELTPENAGPFLINNELGVYFLNRLQHARAPLAVNADGSLTCAAEIAQGSAVTILDGKRPELVAAAKSAAEEAKAHLQGQPPAGILLFDCICRGTILEKDFHQEIEAVRSVFPNTPIAGFLTYGEIARYKGRLDGWHNTTAVVAAIPAN